MNQIFEVNFTSGPEGVKLAAFSDDGVSIDVYDYVSGLSQSNVLDQKGVGQPLPDLDRSLKELDYFFEPDHRYRLRVHYLNTLYTGDGDIDGVLLLAFAGKVVPA